MCSSDAATACYEASFVPQEYFKFAWTIATMPVAASPDPTTSIPLNEVQLKQVCALPRGVPYL